MNARPKNGAESGGKSNQIALEDVGPDGAREVRKTLLEFLVRFDEVEVLFNAPVGYSASTLERVFGGLIRDEGKSKQYLDKHLKLVPVNPIYDDYVGLAHRYIDRIDKEVNDAAAGGAA